MNCVSIALFRAGTTGSIAAAKEAKIRRVIEYFFPRGRRSKIWVDIFVDNPTDEKLTLKILHAGRLTGENVTGGSWMTPALTTSSAASAQKGGPKDSCEVVLTNRILKLHQDYHPIGVDQVAGTITLDGEKYQAWRGTLDPQLGGVGPEEVPFTLWELGSLESGTGTALRLRLDVISDAYKNSFLAYGEAIVLANIRDDLQRFRGTGARAYIEVFDKFSEAHRAPEAFEYLIVAKDREVLDWNAVTLSPLISSRFIESDELATTTSWFATDSPYTDTWKLEASRKSAFVLRIGKIDSEGAEPHILETSGAEDPGLVSADHHIS
jgi:hypothetical protein